MIPQRFSKLLFLLLLLFTAPGFAYASDTFYWRDSYPRGVGTPMHLACGGDYSVYDGGLCYPTCADGFTGVGPLCWKDGRSVSRGVGRALTESCGDKELESGLCYTKCRAGYKGAGPICWGNGPPGYVECGAGAANNTEICVEVTASQTVAAGMLLSGGLTAATKAAQAAKKAEMTAEELEAAGRVTKFFESLIADLGKAYKDAANSDGVVAINNFLSGLRAKALARLSSDKAEAEMILQSMQLVTKVGLGVRSSLRQALNDPNGPIDIIRMAATITALFDPTPFSSVISAYAYPVYVPPVAATPGNPVVPVMTSWDYLYAVSGTDLYYYRLDANQGWSAGGKIGQGWNMRIVTAGDTGELFAVDKKGDLYFYKHDANMEWKVSAQKIGSGFGSMKTISATGNYIGDGERRVIFALSNDGVLWYYNFGTSPSGAITPPTTLQVGWGWQGCATVFAGSDGLVYCIQTNGDLVRYAYDLRDPRARTPIGVKIGNGWNAFTHVFAGSAGQIFAVDQSGTLLAYRDLGGEVIGPQLIGHGWNLQQTAAMKNW